MNKEKKVLDNGLTVTTIRKPHTNTVVIGYSVKAGSHQEEGFPIGIAHFVEHMFFKGTTSRTNIEINQTSTGMGGQINAFTNFEETRYMVVVPKPYWEKGFELLNDVLWNSVFPEEGIELEKSVVCDEIAMYQDDGVSYVMDSLHSHWMRDHPNRQTVLGTMESVMSITRDDILAFVKKYYRPDNMNLVIMGDIEHDDILTAMDQVNIPTSTGALIRTSSPYKGNKRRTHDLEFLKRGSDQAITGFSFFAPSVHDKDSVAMEVFATLFGGNESSRLYRILREERGYAYHLMTQYDYQDDIGFVQGYVGSGQQHIDSIKSVVLEELKHISTNGVTDEEFERTISYLKGGFLLSMDSPYAIFDHVTEMLLYEEETDPQEYIRKIDEVRKEDIERLARIYAKPENVQFVFLKSKKKFNFGWNRFFNK